MANLCTIALTPITLPTWDHLAQIAKRVHHANTDWAFLKGDHASAYKQLPLVPRYANLTAIALRNPQAGKWTGFVPNVLRFGAVSAVIRYNCFPIALPVLINRIFGIPLVSYFGDFGSFPPASIAPEDLEVFANATELPKSDQNTIKSRCDRSIEFLGLTGGFPQIESGMLLRIYLPQEKNPKRSGIIDEILLLRHIRHKP